MSFPAPQLHDSSQPPPAPGTTTVAEERSLPPQPVREQDAPEPRGRSRFNSERPLGVAPVPEGGVAIGGRPDLPDGNANIADKIVGKTQKVIGKYTRNPEMHERGELRETGGKAAAQGRAQAAHD